MAFIGLRIAHDVARLFSEIEVPGNRTSESSYHVTVVYLGENLGIDVLADAIKAVYGVTSKTRPFSVRSSRVSCFPPSEDGKPVIAPIESDALHELREDITKALIEAGVHFDKTFPTYNPHVTLSWTSADTEVKDVRIPTTLEWGAAELVLWGGDNGDKKLVVAFPFSLKCE